MLKAKLKIVVTCTLLLCGWSCASASDTAPTIPATDAKVVTLLDYFQQGQQNALKFLHENPALAARASVVRIMVKFHQAGDTYAWVSGSGCLVKGGYILTCGHILDQLDANPRAEISAFLANGDKVAATVVDREKRSDQRSLRNDWGLLRIPGPQDRGLTIAKAKAGGTVIVMGFPARIGFTPAQLPAYFNSGAGQALSPALLACTVPADDDGTVTPTAGAVPMEGASGGPVINADGEIVGIMVGVSEKYRDDTMTTAISVSSPEFAAVLVAKGSGAAP